MNWEDMRIVTFEKFTTLIIKGDVPPRDVPNEIRAFFEDDGYVYADVKLVGNPKGTVTLNRDGVTETHGFIITRGYCRTG